MILSTRKRESAFRRIQNIEKAEILKTSRNSRWVANTRPLRCVPGNLRYFIPTITSEATPPMEQHAGSQYLLYGAYLTPSLAIYRKVSASRDCQHVKLRNCVNKLIFSKGFARMPFRISSLIAKELLNKNR